MSGPLPRGVGMPQWLILLDFGQLVYDDFGSPPYLVGSALRGKGPRDIDVRVILDDTAFFDRFPPGDDGRSPINHPGTRWASQCRAYAALGKQMTGLPIDFQVQMQSLANQHFASEQRLALLVLR